MYTINIILIRCSEFSEIRLRAKCSKSLSHMPCDLSVFQSVLDTDSDNNNNDKENF